MNKLIKTLAIATILILAMAVSVSAAVLEIDVSNITADNWQNKVNETDPANHHVFIPQDAVADTLNMASPDATVVKRWNGSVRSADDSGCQGERVIVNGSSTTSITIPFVKTVNIQSMKMKFNNGERGYFFKMYISENGSNWTEITDISAGAERGNLVSTYDESGNFGGPALNDVFRSNPFGGTSEDIAAGTITLAQPSVPAKYMKFVFYGHDGARGDWDVTDGSQWMGFNCLVVEGEVYEAPVLDANETAETAATPDETATAAPKAPQTTDPISIILIGAIMSAASMVIVLKKKK